MKKFQILITIAFIISIISSSVYATEPNAGIDQNNKVEQKTRIFKEHDKQFEKGERDPLKRLELKKENIQKEYKAGKITKKEADELIEKVDKHIAKVKEFNSLSLPQKKDRLSSKVKTRIEQEVKDGKLTKEEGEKLIKEFNNNLENWDGKEFPRFMHHKGDKHICK